MTDGHACTHYLSLLHLDILKSMQSNNSKNWQLIQPSFIMAGSRRREKNLGRQRVSDILSQGRKPKWIFHNQQLYRCVSSIIWHICGQWNQQLCLLQDPVWKIGSHNTYFIDPKQTTNLGCGTQWSLDMGHKVLRSALRAFQSFRKRP